MRIKIFLLMLIVGLSSAMAQSVRTERKLITSGNELYRSGKYAEAMQKYREALKCNPQSDVARFNIGLSSVRLSEKTEKNDSLKQALLAEGVKNLTEVASLGANKADLSSKANYNLGNLSFDRQDYDGAIRFYKQALRLNPSFDNARRNLRIAQLRKQNQNDDNKDDNKQDNDKDQQQDQQDQNQQDQQQDQQDQQQDQQNQDQQQNPAENELSNQAAQQILNAVENNEAATRARLGNNNGEKSSGAASSSMRKW